MRRSGSTGRGHIRLGGRSGAAERGGAEWRGASTGWDPIRRSDGAGRGGGDRHLGLVPLLRCPMLTGGDFGCAAWLGAVPDVALVVRRGWWRGGVRCPIRRGASTGWDPIRRSDGAEVP
jgi:hypothetical protein